MCEALPLKALSPPIGDLIIVGFAGAKQVLLVKCFSVFGIPPVPRLRDFVEFGIVRSLSVILHVEPCVVIVRLLFFFAVRPYGWFEFVVINRDFIGI